MAGYQPPYSITPTILNQVVEVGELLGRWATQAEQSSPLCCAKKTVFEPYKHHWQ